MVYRKTWEEFRETGLLFFINQILHVIGWAITIDIDDNEIKDVYPARVKFRGFDGKIVDQGYTKVTRFLKNNIDELLSECEPLE
jgi:hypothetical protein